MFSRRRQGIYIVSRFACSPSFLRGAKKSTARRRERGREIRKDQIPWASPSLGKSFDKCAVDFVALIRHCAETLVVEGLAAAFPCMPFEFPCIPFSSPSHSPACPFVFPCIPLALHLHSLCLPLHSCIPFAFPLHSPRMSKGFPYGFILKDFL